MHFTFSLAILALAAGASAELNLLALGAGLDYFGTATDNGQLDDNAYVAILRDSEEFGQITPGNTQKWYFTEGTQGKFDFSKGDVIVDFAQKNKQMLRCHSLVWHSQLPSWVTSDTWTNETLTKVMTTHITSQVTHYKGECYAWDVVNEAIIDGPEYRDSVFYKTIGEYYIPMAFAAAAAADPKAKLYYNDYNIEAKGTKLDGTLALVDFVKGAGAKIDGVGLQGHFVVGQVGTADVLADVLKQLTAKGVEVAYTELDVRHPALPADDAAVAQQATDYAAVVSACLQVAGCVGITVWDFYDKYSWIPSVFPDTGDACLYDKDLKRKPAWTAVSSVLAGAAKSGLSTLVPAATSGPVAAAPAGPGTALPYGPDGTYDAVAPPVFPAYNSGAGPSPAPAAITPPPSPPARPICTGQTKTVYVTVPLPS